jgi:ethanolamine ammonia-lyase small subunit
VTRLKERLVSTPHFKPLAPEVLKRLKETTPARIGVGRAGTRPLTSTWLEFRRDHAMARDAVKSEFSDEFLAYAEGQGYPVVQSLAVNKSDFISFPLKGRRASDEAIAVIKERCPQNVDVQIVVSDGLSARAIESNIKDVLPMLLDGLALEKISCGVPVVARYGRVAIADHVGHELKAQLAINLIGERPGMSSAESMSAYLTYNPGPHTISSDRTVVSNIHERGTLPIEAGAYIVQLAKKILTHRLSGVKLQQVV